MWLGVHKFSRAQNIFFPLIRLCKLQFRLALAHVADCSRYRNCLHHSHLHDLKAAKVPLMMADREIVRILQIAIINQLVAQWWVFYACNNIRITLDDSRIEFFFSILFEFSSSSIHLLLLHHVPHKFAYNDLHNSDSPFILSVSRCMRVLTSALRDRGDLHAARWHISFGRLFYERKSWSWTHVNMRENGGRSASDRLS